MSREISIVGDIAYVPLTQGQVAIIDVSDVPLVDGHLWFAYRSGGRFYAGRSVNKRTLPMHRHLLGLSDPSIEGDHKDGDGLNNRRANLREASKMQNMQNRTRTKNVTGFKGVNYVPKLGKYIAVLQKNKQRVTLGYYAEAKEAARAYDMGAMQHFGEFAATNQRMGLL